MKYRYSFVCLLAIVLFNQYLYGFPESTGGKHFESNVKSQENNSTHLNPQKPQLSKKAVQTTDSGVEQGTENILPRELYKSVQGQGEKSVDMSLLDGTEENLSKDQNIQSEQGLKIQLPKLTQRPSEKNTEITKEKEVIYKQDVQRASVDFAAQLLRYVYNSSSLKLQTEMTKTSVMFDKKFLPDDINFAKRRYEKLGEHTRSTVKSMYSKLATLKQDQPEAHKVFCKDLVRQQLRNYFGVDANNFVERLVKLKHEDEFVDSLVGSPDFKALKNAKSPVDKLNALAKLSDRVMNHVTEEIATFETSFDAQGQCLTKITSKGADEGLIVYESVINNKGKETTRKLTIGDMTCTMDIVKGKNTIKIGDSKPERLAIDPSTLTTMYAASVIFKSTVKLGLTAFKQGVVNVVGFVVPASVSFMLTLGYCIAAPVLMGLPKIGRDKTGNVTFDSSKVESTFTGFQFTGHNASVKDNVKAVATMTLQLAKFAIGDNGQMAFGLHSQGKALLSKDANRVFRKGTWISNLLGGKIEAEDMTEGYIDFIEPFVEASHFMLVTPLATLFPRTLGTRLLSEAEINFSDSNKLNDSETANFMTLYSDISSVLSIFDILFVMSMIAL